MHCVGPQGAPFPMPPHSITSATKSPAAITCYLCLDLNEPKLRALKGCTHTPGDNDCPTPGAWTHLVRLQPAGLDHLHLISTWQGTVEDDGISLDLQVTAPSKRKKPGPVLAFLFLVCLFFKFGGGDSSLAICSKSLFCSAAPTPPCGRFTPFLGLLGWGVFVLSPVPSYLNHLPMKAE